MKRQLISMFILSAVLMLWLGGCLTLRNDSAVIKNIDNQDTFPAIQTNQVYFFLSKDAFPPDLQQIPVGTLWTPENSQWTYAQVVERFQEKAAEIGANAVVFESLGKNELLYGNLYYSGYATAYRLFQQDTRVAADLSASQYGTQSPNLQKVK